MNKTATGILQVAQGLSPVQSVSEIEREREPLAIYHHDDKLGCIMYANDK
jgi:hypothetical protein